MRGRGGAPLLLALLLTACVPGVSPIPNPLPILIPDGSVVARGGVVTLTNLEAGVGREGALYLEGEGLAVVGPNKKAWDCRTYEQGWACYKVPDLLKNLPLELNYVGAVRIGNLSYYLKKPDGTVEFKLKRLQN